MDGQIFADLHVHTDHSDGTQTIETVVEAAKAQGLGALAISDHDTVDHWDEVRTLTERAGIEAVRSVEMSCYDDDVRKKIHVVGLWLNDDAPHVKELCDRTLKGRDSYHRKLIEEFSEKGFPLDIADVERHARYGYIFKMHVFQALMDRYPDTMTIDRYRELFAGKTSYEVDKQMNYIPIEAGIQAILKDGGVPVIAHPCEYDNYDQIEKYVAFGLCGIEVSHPSMREHDYQLTSEFASRFDLLKSGGSDFHDFKMAPNLGRFGLTKTGFEELKGRR